MLCWVRTEKGQRYTTGYNSLQNIFFSLSLFTFVLCSRCSSQFSIVIFRSVFFFHRFMFIVCYSHFRFNRIQLSLDWVCAHSQKSHIYMYNLTTFSFSLCIWTAHWTKWIFSDLIFDVHTCFLRTSMQQNYNWECV